MLWGSACSCSDDTDDTATKATGGSGGSGAAGAGGAGGGLVDGCAPGEPCGGNGVCTDGDVCCDPERVCATQCCADGDVCSFSQCATPGNICIDAADCAANEYCEYGLGDGGDGGSGQGGAGGTCQGGVEPQSGRCLPKPKECDPGEDPGDPQSCLEKCEYRPPISAFSPELKFSWGDPGNPNHNVMMAPVVIQLDDDNCDGNVDQRDIPEVVFFTFLSGDYNNGTGSAATLRAISIVDGVVVEKWATNTGGPSPDYPGRSIAAGNIDGVPGSEIVVCTTDNRVRAYRADGSELWLSAPIGVTCFMPSLADLDQDGDVEVIVRSQVLDGVTGAAEVSAFSPVNTDFVVVSDVDVDGQLDIVTPSRAYTASGNLIVDTGVTGRHAAVGDLDNDGIPEIVAVDTANHALNVWHVDPAAPGGFEVIRQGIDINGTISPNPCCLGNPASSGCTSGGGPPTIADFNGDGFPDVGLAGGIGYVVFDGEALTDPNVADVDTILWITQTQDCSSAQTGSSVFDFDGDGSAEVIYADEVNMHVYAGPTGQELLTLCNTNGTLFEYPLVADVDNDGHADIIVGSNSYSGFNCAGTKTTGIRVFGDTEGKWVRTRRVWNQHPYHVTNIAEDGQIPTVEAANYLASGLNNFRQNVQPLGEFSAPDLVVSVEPSCAGDYELLATVRNVGEAAVPPGVVVGFYEGVPSAGNRLGEAFTTQTLYSLGSEVVSLPLAAQPQSLVYAVVDDGSPPHTWHECRTDNNESDGTDPECIVAN